jgi:hypothetical protein
MRVSADGYWDGDDVNDEHCYDPSLEKWIISFLKKEGGETLLDLGCGLATYSKSFHRAGFKVKAYDGNPYTPELTGGFAEVMNLATPCTLPISDWVICLEVGEHIPKECESVIIHNMHAHAKKGIITSWAVPGQGGTGHVNCQTNEYIKSIFGSLGYTNDMDAELDARKHCDLHWFRDTVMIFRK